MAARFTLVSALMVSVVVFSSSVNATTCPSFQIAESIPLGLRSTLNTTLETSDAWLSVINTAKTSLDIAAFYVTLTDGTSAEGADDGVAVYNAIIAASKRGVKVRFAINVPSKYFPSTDVQNLIKGGYATASFLNYTQLIQAEGILHTKFMISDNQTFYIGSANMDWRSLTQVKEFGVFVPTCPTMGGDLARIFATYWLLGQSTTVPSPFPPQYSPQFSMSDPATISFTEGGGDTSLFFSYSPPPLKPEGWTRDLDNLLSHLNTATEYVHIEMMDFMPIYGFSPEPTYWPPLDQTIRATSYANNTQYRILIGHWNHSSALQHNYMASLDVLPNVEVRWFIVPPFNPATPYTRVAHGKWIVTESSLYVTTSNFEGTYFNDTSGVGLSIRDNMDAITDAQNRFLRDWDSAYSSPIPPINCP